MKVTILILAITAFVSIANITKAEACGWAGCGWDKNDQQETDQGKDYDRNSSVNTDQDTQDSSANDDQDNENQVASKR